jgi:hypothetical protein
MLAVVLVGAGLVLAFFLGMRFTLARQRWRELQTGLVRQNTAGSMEATFGAILRQRDAAIANNLLDHLRILNASLFILIWNWDLLLVLDQFRATPVVWSLEKGWRKKFAARQLALVIYEACTKLDKLFDPAKDEEWSVRKAVRGLHIDKVADPVLDRAHTQLTEFLARHRELLSGIRNNVIGHRDKDVGQQLAWMRRADVQKLEGLGWESLELSNSLLGALTEIGAILKPQSA